MPPAGTQGCVIRFIMTSLFGSSGPFLKVYDVRWATVCAGLICSRKLEELQLRMPRAFQGFLSSALLLDMNSCKLNFQGGSQESNFNYFLWNDPVEGWGKLAVPSPWPWCKPSWTALGGRRSLTEGQRWGQGFQTERFQLHNDERPLIPRIKLLNPSICGTG